MVKFNELKQLVSEIEADVDKFYDKGNAAAGTRIRKTMQSLKGLAQDIRVEVQNQKNDA